MKRAKPFRAKLGNIYVTVHRRGEDDHPVRGAALLLRIWQGCPRWCYPHYGDGVIWLAEEPVAESGWIRVVWQMLQTRAPAGIVLDFCQEHGWDGDTTKRWYPRPASV